MKTRGGATVKPGPPPKRLKVERVSKRLAKRKDLATKQRLKDRMQQLADRKEYTPKEAAAKPYASPMLPLEGDAMQDEPPKEMPPVPPPERVMASTDFELRRRRLVRFLSRSPAALARVATAEVTRDNVAGPEGSGWRAVVAAGETSVEAAAGLLSAARWRVMDFSRCGEAEQATEKVGDREKDHAAAGTGAGPSAPVPATAATAAVAAAAAALPRVWVAPEGAWYFRWADVVQQLARDAARDELIASAAVTGAAHSMAVARERFLRDGLWVGIPLEPSTAAAVSTASSPSSTAAAALSSASGDGTPAAALTPAQVASVRAASVDFFERVVHTVSVRGLHGELERGFESFRERGGGRYDMNVPALSDDPSFAFLAAPDAPWMPAVRAFLAPPTLAEASGSSGGSSGGGGCSGGGADDGEVKLIHSGVFLSLPGSATQVYHTDGVHLSAVEQLPPHALNVRPLRHA